MYNILPETLDFLHCKHLRSKYIIVGIRLDFIEIQQLKFMSGRKGLFHAVQPVVQRAAAAGAQNGAATVWCLLNTAAATPAR